MKKLFTLHNNLIRHIVSIIGISLMAGNIYAQSTIPVCGGSDKNDQSGSMTYTVGQVDYLFSNSSSGNAVAGVQQPFDDHTAYRANCDGVEMVAYPNPTPDNTRIICDALDANYPFVLTDLSGKILYEDKMKGEYTNIPMSHLIAGSYILKIICGEGKDDYSTFKIIKK